MSIRKASVAGQFYPDTKEQIDNFFEYFENILSDSDFDNRLLEIRPKAMIVPHAGYVYSGFTASVAYQIASNHDYDRVIVIGPSHKVAFNGISISEFDSYETPSGNIDIDSEYINILKDKFNFDFFESVHQEHSTETQVPFIKHYINKPLVEMVYSNYGDSSLANILKFLLADSANLVLISTDLSHFYDIKKANTLDNICMHAIANLDIKSFDDGCEACGMIGIKALVEASKELELDVKMLDYRTSADASGDSSSVVGYLSAIVY
jgi:AmmeMemoRadiSam system protein B